MIEEMKKRGISKERRELLRANVSIHRENILQVLQPKSASSRRADNIRREYDCPICFEDMKAPLQIFACSNDHYFCSECQSTPILSCPLCREDFEAYPPTRRIAAERLRQTISL